MEEHVITKNIKYDVMNHDLLYNLLIQFNRQNTRGSLNYESKEIS